MRQADDVAARDAGAPRAAQPGLRRVVVDRVSPEIDAGRFPIKRSIGESVAVVADMLADGHDVLAGVLKYRHISPEGDMSAWSETRLTDTGNDAWTASFAVTALGTYEYTVEGWVDQFSTWLRGLLAKAEANQDVESELVEGARLIEEAAAREVRLKPDTTYDAQGSAGMDGDVVPAENRHGPDVASGFSGTERSGVVSGFSRTEQNLRLLEFADVLRRPLPQKARVAAASDPELRALMDQRQDRTHAGAYDRVLTVQADPEIARVGAWYEMFPRSCTPDPSRSGTFREAEERLPEIAAMGFDVLYLPPIHPIGTTHRKGPNNSLQARPGDPGSPWAIGSAAGGHTAIEPGLGTLEDFDRFVRLANRLGLHVALDIAFQASPDHPWVREHPEWFKHRPDGSIKYAENPPKKYQDIYPLNFESEAWESLWTALRDVFLFWTGHGVRIFRVDNPHTKSFRFWEWVIAEVRREHPDTVFLSEAFTRPKVMRYLAKLGFTLDGATYTWTGDWNYVKLDPAERVAHILVVRTASQ